MNKNIYIDKMSKIINIEFINEFLKLINKRCPYFRKLKYSNEYYLYYILLVLVHLQKWKSLTLLHTDKKENHYKSIQQVHLKWCKLNIYEDVYKLLLNKYKYTNIKQSKNLFLFIDSTDIYNKKGIENIGYGSDPKKKKTRISTICDINKNILSITFVDTKMKLPKLNGSQIRKTLSHDSKSIEKSIDNLLIDVSKFKKIILVGDKGYARKKEDKKMLLKTRNTQIVYPKRKNQKTKTSINDKKLLKNRYIIENVFANMKMFTRICLRNDRLNITFKGFLFLSTIINFKK